MALAAALLVLVLAIPASYAARYTVGDNGGWNTNVDYSAWTRDKTFRVGDTLVFTYGSTHSVDEVTKSNYDNCISGNPLKSHNGGNTEITLSNAGSMYFLCPTSGHCAQGMKLDITVEAASGNTPTTPTSPAGSTPPPGQTPPSGSTPPPSGAPSILTNNNNGLMLGFWLLLGAVAAILG